MTKDFHLGDARTLLAVLRTGSLTEAARSLGSTPSQVSKAVKRMERVLGADAGSRRGSGDPALLSELEALVAQADRLSERRSHNDFVAAFPTELSALGVNALLRGAPAIRWRMLDWSSLPLHGATPIVCDVALSFARDHYPTFFDATPLTEIALGLFVAPTHPLASAPVSVDALPTLPLVTTHTPLADLLGAAHDATRVSVLQQVSSFSAALSAAASTTLVAIGPIEEAASHLRDGSLVALDAAWLRPRRVDLLCHAERVSARLRSALQNAFRAYFSA